METKGKEKEIDTKIRVVVRCRPFVAEESRSRKCLQMSNDLVVIGDKKFSFEQVFNEESRQEEVYESCVKSLVEGCFQGFNGTVFAYGQTGSGKTYSIMGNNLGSEEDESEVGIIPRALHHMFDTLNQHLLDGKTMASIRVSMIEIYNDECRDLIHPEIPTRDIMIREDKHGRIFFTGAREEIVSNAKTAIQFLQQGALNRTTAETLMNQSSSRSHAIFTVSLEMIEYTKEGEAAVEDGSFIHAKLHLVDLAGSERAKRTGAVGTRFKESVGINQGLLSLGKVIRALTSNPITHVPYRESKLTRFLQDSLGGNSRTVLLACISPSEFNLHETLNTLHYAQRAKFIQNKISANISHGIISSDLQEDLESSLVISLRAEIVRMQKEMSEMVNIQSTNLPHRNLVHNDGNKQEEYDYENISLQRNSSTNNLTTNHNNGMMNFKMVHKHYLSLKQVLFTLNDILSPTQTITERIIDDFEMNQKEKSASSSIPTTANTPRYPPDYKLATACQLASETITKVIEQINADPSHQLFSAQQFAQQTQQLFRSSLDKESFQKLVQHDPSNKNQQNKEELEKDLLIEQLTKQLEDCQEDLKRDEEIFSEKIKELKKYRKQVKELDTENKNIKKNYVNLKKNLQKLNKLTNSLRNSHDYQHSLQQQRKKNLNSIDSDQENDGNDLYQQDSLQVDPLSTSSTGMKKPLSTRGDGGSSSIGLSTARAERREGFNRANNNNNHHEHMTINQLTGANNNNNTSEQDDLNISMAVALTEPDISQLIEDIELLSKEKEELFYLSQQHEEKIEELIKEKSNLQNYEKENIELLKSFSNLQKEYQFLQTKLEEKEEIIQKTLLETTSTTNPRPSSSSSSSKPLSLQEKEEELRKLIHNEYLSKFQLLNSLLEKKEKEISDYKSLQKNTEKENSFLMNEKSKLEKQFQELKEKLLQQQKESVVDDQERKRGGGDEEDEDYLEYSMNTQFSIHLSFDECISFLEKEMNEILEIGNIQLEITKLSQQLNMIEKETIDLQNEEKELLSLYENYQSIHKNYGMIDDKIKNLKLKKTNVKNKILKLKTSFEEEQKKKRSTTMDGNNPRDLYENNEDYTQMKTNMEIMKKELSEIDFQIQSYQSYQSEMKERHQEIVSQFFSIVRSHSSNNNNNNNQDDNGEEDPEEKKDHHKDSIEEMDFENKLSEIREDLETYETEKEIISNRLLIEKQSLLNSFAKFQQKKKNKNNSNNQNKKKTVEEEKDDDIEDSSNAIGMNTRTSFDKSLNYLLMKMKEFCFQKFPHLLSSSSSSTNKKTTTPTTTTATTHELLLLEDYLLKLLFQFILQLKLSSKNIDNQQKQTKELLDTKCNEYDQLIILFTKLKNEFHETKQSMRKEHEEKIMFLLQQIKILESKYSSSSSSSRPSTASGMMLPAPPGGPGLLASQQQMGLPPPSTPYQSSSAQQQQQHHLLMNRLNEMERKQFEEFLMEFSSSHHHSHHPPSHNNNNNNPRPTSAAPWDTAGMGSSSLFMNYEIFKRYISEKERRELLEKKNVELLKELKSVRSLPSSK